MWDEITYPFRNFNGVTVWEWINNFILHFHLCIITYPYWDLSWNMLRKGYQNNNPTYMYGRWWYDICDLASTKANLREFIAATSLVILIKLDSNRRFFSLWDLEIWWMTSKNNRRLFLYYIKLCALFQIHRWNRTRVTVRKRSIRVKIGNFLSCVTFKCDGWPWKTIGRLLYATLSFVHPFKATREFKLELQSGNAQFVS